MPDAFKNTNVLIAVFAVIGIIVYFAMGGADALSAHYALYAVVVVGGGPLVLSLVRGLPTAGQQTWCLGDLLQSWQLDDEAREEILAAAPTPSARRRLARRVARAE